MASLQILAHAGVHGDQPIGGALADLVYLLGPVLIAACAWMLVRRAGQ